ncbi:MAG: N-acetyltransferase [Bryobacterales bacterium]
MAAAGAPIGDLSIVDLREMRGEDLGYLLEQQNLEWRRRLHWDFAPTGSIIRRFLDARNLHGYAVVQGGRPVGYCYFIYEDGKALVGDLYLEDGFRQPAWERWLLENTVKAAAVYPGVRRVEGQALGLSYELQEDVLYSRPVSVVPRLFMMRVDLDQIEDAIPCDPPESLRFGHWDDSDLEPAAQLIAGSYARHIDSRINDQYRTVAGARRFLINTTQHTGCGVFLRRASVVARRGIFRSVAGVCLASRVDDSAGHVTQICVAPQHRGLGVGREMLRRTLTALARQGCEVASLTVTASNKPAIELYERFGFTILRRFSAFIWERDSE